MSVNYIKFKVLDTALEMCSTSEMKAHTHTHTDTERNVYEKRRFTQNDNAAAV